MNEMWKDIVGYEGLYQISNFGRVKSLARYRSTPIGKDRWYSEKILKCGKCSNGYLFVDLRPRKEKTCYLVHRLVAEAFIPNDELKTTVNHKDSNRANNNVLNLEWCSQSENMYHARTKGTAKFCYIEKPQEIKNIYTGEIIKFKTAKELCNFFGKSNCWIGNKRKQVSFPIIIDGWCIY